MMKWTLLKKNTRLFNVGGEGVMPWVFEREIFNLSLRGITLQVTSTITYSVKEVGQM